MKCMHLAAIAAFFASASPTLAADLEVATLTPVKSTEYATKHDDTTAIVLHHIVEGLVAYDSKLDVQPLLAKSVSVSDDGRVYTFELRDDVTFHNGERMTAAEVVWNWRRFADPKRDWGSHCREWYDGSAEGYHRPVRIVSIEAPNDATVVITLQSKNALFLDLVASNHCISGIVHPDSVDEDGAWIKPIGTGPYMLESADLKGPVRLTRFAAYAPRSEPRDGFAGDRTALADTLTFTHFENFDAAKAAFEDGAIHAIVNAPFAASRGLRDRDGVTVHWEQTPAWHQLILQTRTDPMLADVRLRHAIDLAIDERAITKAVFGEDAVANPSAVYFASPFHTENHGKGLGYDTKRAKALLKEVGYAGEPIEIQASSDPYPTFHAIAEEAAKMMRKVGLNAHVREMSWPDHDEHYGSNKYQMTSITFSLRTDPSLMYSTLAGQKADHSWYLWEDNEAAALTAYSTVVDAPEDRQALFDDLHEKMIAWTPTIGICNTPRFHIVSDQVDGFEAWALGIPRFWGVSVTAGE